MQINVSAVWRAIWAIIGFLGWKSLVISALVSLGWGSWAVIYGEGWPLATAIGFCVFVLFLVLWKMPAFYRVLSQANPDGPPNPEVWRHKQIFPLYEAACLLAGINPTQQVPRGDADGWFRMLQDAEKVGEIKRIQSIEDNAEHIFRGQYHAHEWTRISREELTKFCIARDRSPEFLK